MRKHVFPISEPSFLDRRTFGTQDWGSSGVLVRKFSEQIVGNGTSTFGTNFNHLMVAWNKNDNDDNAIKKTPSFVDGLTAEEIEIPAGLIICIGSKDRGSQYSYKNIFRFPGHPSDAFSIPGTGAFTNDRLNRSDIGDKKWITIMWTGTRWVWLGSNNWY